jgi:hypothetical protein
MPIGAFASISMYRVTPASVSINGTSYSIATAPASGGLSSGATLLGTYLAEKAGLSPKGKLVQRTDAIGTPSDKSLLRDDPELSMTLQSASIGTPSLMPGDCMEVNIGMKATSTAGTPAPIALTRWFIKNDGINYDAGDPTKFTVTFELDRQNSASTLAEF